jgi:hypothetical protein
MKKIIIVIFLLLPLFAYAETENIAFDRNLPYFTRTSFQAIDLGSDGVHELMASSGPGEKPLVTLLRQDGSVINEILVYDENFSGGVVAQAADLDGDGQIEIVTAPFSKGGPHIRVWDGFGKNIHNFFAFEKTSRNPLRIKITTESEIAVAVLSGEVVQVKYFDRHGNLLREEKTSLAGSSFNFSVITKDATLSTVVKTHSGELKNLELKQLTPTGDTALGDYIEINTATQKLSYYDDGYLQNTFTVSTGAASTPTPKGTYKIENHHARPWSRLASLWMPNWMAFTPDGAYGIHELPEWPGGVKEGANHLGTPVSHGCVRLGVGPAEELYNWAKNGTPVVIK